MFFAAAAVAFQNCAPAAKDEDKNLSSLCKAQVYEESVSSNKLANIKGLVRKASNEPIKLSLRIDTLCAQTQGSLSQSLLSPEKMNLKTFMATWETLDLEQARLDIEADSCILGAYLTSDRILTPLQQADIEVEYPLSNDPFANQAYFKTMGFDRGQLRFFHPTFGIKSKVVVAVIDTGVDYNHPDLQPSMWSDANGNHGIRLYDGAMTPLDDHFHGTHVSGIIGAASNNGLGIRAIAGGVAEIMAINATLGPGTAAPTAFSDEGIADAIDFAVANGAQVINLSLGGPSAAENPILRDAVVRAINAGVIIVAASGNSNADAINYFPAANSIDLVGILSVGSINTDFTKSSFSNFGNTVDILANGNESEGRVDRSILSTFPQGEYNRIQGTSMATPVVTAAFALAIGFLQTHDINYNPTVLENIIINSAQQVNSLVGVSRNGRVLDLDRMSATLYQMANIAFDPVAEYDADYITNVLNQPPDVEPTDPAEVCQ